MCDFWQTPHQHLYSKICFRGEGYDGGVSSGNNSSQETSVRDHFIQKKYNFSNYREMSWQVKSIFLKYWASLYLFLSSILSLSLWFLHVSRCIFRQNLTFLFKNKTKQNLLVFSNCFNLTKPWQSHIINKLLSLKISLPKQKQVCRTARCQFYF